MFVRKLDTKRSYTHDSLTAGYRALWIVLPSTQEAVMALASNSHAPNGRLQNLMWLGFAQLLRNLGASSVKETSAAN